MRTEDENGEVDNYNGQTKGLNRTQSILRFHYTYKMKYSLIKQEHRRHAKDALAYPLTKPVCMFSSVPPFFQPVGGEPAVYLRVAGRKGEPETLTENILSQLKARVA